MEKNWPAISILIMSYKQADFIADCIQSALSQDYPGELEIIVCDDCSPDRSFEVVQEVAAQYTGPHKLITHRCEQNGRVAINMNVAVGLASHEWLMRVDGDDILHPDRARLTALAIMAHPKARAITGQKSVFSTTISPIKNIADEKLQFKEVDATDFAQGKNSKNMEWWGCMMTLHREIFSYFGPLPAELAVLDDTMFASRALMLGSFVEVSNGTLLYYRRHENNMSSDRKASASIRERMQADAAARDYYRRGMVCHAPILKELQTYTTNHPQCKGLLQYFTARFAELKRQGLFWQCSWQERIAQGKIQGNFIKKLPWAIRCSCPFVYALTAKIKK